MCNAIIAFFPYKTYNAVFMLEIFQLLEFEMTGKGIHYLWWSLFLA